MALMYYNTMCHIMMPNYYKYNVDNVDLFNYLPALAKYLFKPKQGLTRCPQKTNSLISLHKNIKSFPQHSQNSFTHHGPIVRGLRCAHL